MLLIRKFCYTFFTFSNFFNVYWLRRIFLQKILKRKHPWADTEQGHDFKNYASTDDYYSQVLLNTIEKVARREDSILDVCCNQGRYLRALHARGYRDLHGFDIMAPAVDYFLENYKQQMPEIDIVCCDAKSFFKKNLRQEYDFAITYSATLELLEPSAKVIQRLSERVRKGAVFILNENGHSYPRFWSAAFSKQGLSVILKQKLSSHFTLFVLAKNNYEEKLTQFLQCDVI